MIEDKQLIRQFAAEHSEPAFAELVRRHLKMVYAAALRQVNGDAAMAEDVAQAVFTDFARKAGKLQNNNSIAGWLYTSTRFAAANVVRAEARRREREQTVVAMNEMNSHTNESWNELRPMIDEALGELGETDCEAIVLRYFEAYEFSLIGAALGVSENAARMRVDRALEKLRAVLQKRGMATTEAVLAGVLANTSAATVLAQLAAQITCLGMTQVAATSAGSSSILRMMVMKKASLAAIGVFALSVAVTLVVRNLSGSNQQAGVAASLKTTQSSSTLAGEAVAPSVKTGDPDVFKKIVQRHDEQARATAAQDADKARARWEKEVADFDSSTNEEPGVKKFSRKMETSIASGLCYVECLWRIHTGKSALIFVTPTINPDETNHEAVLIKSRLIEVTDEVVDSLGISRESAVTFSADGAQALFNSLTKPGSDMVAGPKVVESLGQMASVSIGSEAMIEGKQQFLGLWIKLFPTRATNGSGLDIATLARYTVAADPTDAPLHSQ